jgi:hypothetical protein
MDRNQLPTRHDPDVQRVLDDVRARVHDPGARERLLAQMFVSASRMASTGFVRVPGVEETKRRQEPSVSGTDT